MFEFAGEGMGQFLECRKAINSILCRKQAKEGWVIVHLMDSIFTTKFGRGCCTVPDFDKEKLALLRGKLLFFTSYLKLA